MIILSFTRGPEAVITNNVKNLETKKVYLATTEAHIVHASSQPVTNAFTEELLHLYFGGPSSMYELTEPASLMYTYCQSWCTSLPLEAQFREGGGAGQAPHIVYSD